MRTAPVKTPLDLLPRRTSIGLCAAGRAEPGIRMFLPMVFGAAIATAPAWTASASDFDVCCRSTEDHGTLSYTDAVQHRLAADGGRRDHGAAAAEAETLAPPIGDMFMQPMTRQGSATRWDFFISHASEDKEGVARPLATALIQLGFSVWFDELSLRLGDSLSRAIDQGIRNSKYGIVILSPNFFAKQWPQRELDALGTLEATRGVTSILPIWHNIDQNGISNFSAMLADKVGISTTNGLNKVVEEVKRAFAVDYREDLPEIRAIDRVLRPLVEELVADPTKVSLKYIPGDLTTVIELRVDPGDLGKLIGKEGRTARALRTILGQIGMKLRKRFVLEMLE